MRFRGIVRPPRPHHAIRLLALVGGIDVGHEGKRRRIRLGGGGCKRDNAETGGDNRSEE